VVRDRKPQVALTLVVVAGLGVGYGLFFTAEAPDELAVNDTQQLFTTGKVSDAGFGDPSGSWKIQSGSEAGYRVRDSFAREPSASDSVGTTRAVTGGLTVQAEGQEYTLKDIDIEVDLSKLENVSPRRENRLRTGGLDTDSYPWARFVGKGPISLPDAAAAGRTVELTLEGLLTIHEVTKQVSIPIAARIDGEHAQVVGSFTFPMAQFGIQPPDVANIVTTEPTGTMEFRLLFAKAG
jgi:polyisoprenoid-binding protein YceI